MTKVENSRINQAILQVKNFLLETQDSICHALEAEDGKAVFTEDNWLYQQGCGGGKTRILNQGTIFEKAGVNFSHIAGDHLPKAASATRPELAGRTFKHWESLS